MQMKQPKQKPKVQPKPGKVEPKHRPLKRVLYKPNLFNQQPYTGNG